MFVEQTSKSLRLLSKWQGSGYLQKQPTSQRLRRATGSTSETARAQIAQSNTATEQHIIRATNRVEGKHHRRGSFRF
jgi:hypothetical protein